MKLGSCGHAKRPERRQLHIGRHRDHLARPDTERRHAAQRRQCHAGAAGDVLLGDDEWRDQDPCDYRQPRSDPRKVTIRTAIASPVRGATG